MHPQSPRRWPSLHAVLNLEQPSNTKTTDSSWPSMETLKAKMSINKHSYTQKEQRVTKETINDLLSEVAAHQNNITTNTTPTSDTTPPTTPSPYESDDEQDNRTPNQQFHSNKEREIEREREKRREESTRNLEEFLMALTRALHLYGCPSHILEFHMTKVAKGLGHRGAVFAVFPTYSLVSFDRDELFGSQRHTIYFETAFGYNMHKLQLVDEVARRVASYASTEPPVGNAAATSVPILDTAVAEFLASANDDSTIQLPSDDKIGSICELETFFDTPTGSIPTSPVLPADPISSDRRKTHPVTFSDPTKNHSPHRIVQITKSNDPNSSPSRAGRLKKHPLRPDKKQDEAAIASLRGAILTLASEGPGFFSSGTPNSSSGTSTPFSIDDETMHPPSPAFKSSFNLSSKYKKFTATKKSRTRPPKSKKRFEEIFTTLALEDAHSRLSEIVKQRPLYPPWLQCLVTGVASAGCAGMFFEGSWWDMLLSFALGTLVGILGVLSAKSENFSRVYEFTSAFLVGAITRLLIYFGAPICYAATTLSSLIFLLQGLTLTLAMVELATRNMICGTTRLAFGLVITGIIGYGLYLGTSLMEMMLNVPQLATAETELCMNPIDPRFYFLFFPPTVISFCMLIQAHPRQFLSMVSAATLGFLVNYFGKEVLSPNLASSVAAFTVGVYSNVLARCTGKPAIVSALCSLLILVPGAMAVRSFSAFLSNDSTAGIGITMTVLTVSMAIGIGLFMSSLIVTPQEKFRFFPDAKHGGVAMPGDERKKIWRNVSSLHF